MIHSFQIKHLHAAELITTKLLIVDATTGAELLADLYYQHFDVLLFHEKNVHPDFFDLSTGLAGELLQKASLFQLRLGFIGNFDAYSSKSLHDLIRESNRQGRIVFASSREEVVTLMEANAPLH